MPRATSPSSTRMTRACIPMRTPSCEQPGLGRYPGVAVHVRATMAEPGDELMPVVPVIRSERGTGLTATTGAGSSDASVLAYAVEVIGPGPHDRGPWSCGRSVAVYVGCSPVNSNGAHSGQRVSPSTAPYW